MDELSGTRFYEEVIKAVAFYAAGCEDGSYEDQMDLMGIHLTDDQWEYLCDVIDKVDCLLAPTDKGTEHQKAIYEGRPIPNVFDPSIKFVKENKCFDPSPPMPR